MSDVLKLKKFSQLKHVLRDIDVDKRIESTAEHCRSSLILADYFLSLMKLSIDRMKVYELLMYHDLVEIETGDTPVHHLEARKAKVEQERLAMSKVGSEMPDVLREKYFQLFREFEAKETVESRFANAVDKLDADISAMDSTDESFVWWTEDLAREIKQKHYLEFPEINAVFEEVVLWYKKRGVI